MHMKLLIAYDYRSNILHWNMPRWILVAMGWKIVSDNNNKVFVYVTNKIMRLISLYDDTVNILNRKQNWYHTNKVATTWMVSWPPGISRQQTVIYLRKEVMVGTDQIAKKFINPNLFRSQISAIWPIRQEFIKSLYVWISQKKFGDADFGKSALLVRLFIVRSLLEL